MSTKYFIDATGIYIGAFEGATPPAGAVEVPHAPSNANGQWRGGDWVYPEQPLEAPEIISRRQFYEGLAETERITKAEALAAIKTGAIPPALQLMLDAMTDPDEKFKADMLLSGASEFQRSHPLVSVFAAAEGMSEQDVDGFWLLCSLL